MRVSAWVLGAVCLFAGVLLSQSGPRERVGAINGGGYLLPSGWKLTPAGKDVAVGSFPLSSALSKDGRYLIVLNAGGPQRLLSVLDVSTRAEVTRTSIPDGWLGLTFNPKGDRLYVGAGAHAAILEFSYADGKLSPARTFVLVDEAKRTARDFTGDVCFSPDGRLLYAADVYRNSIVVVNPLSGVVIQRIKTGRRPYRILFHPDGKSFFVTSWADGSVIRYQADGSPLGLCGWARIRRTWFSAQRSREASYTLRQPTLTPYSRFWLLAEATWPVAKRSTWRWNLGNHSA